MQLEELNLRKLADIQTHIPPSYPSIDSTNMATPTNTPPSLGSMIRMRPLKPSELPAHPSLTGVQTNATPPQLQAFVAAVLDEGHSFITEYLPATFKVKADNKPSPPSIAGVQLLMHEISAHDIPEEGRTMGAGETWVARTSVHENAAKQGTANWEEFDAGLRKDHSRNERQYTPNIMDAHCVADWKDELKGAGAGDWKEVDTYLMEMLHKMPAPLSKRVFTVLVVAGKRDGEFVDVQIPVDMGSIEGAKYVKDSKVTLGMYCSVERGELIEDGAKVRWSMGTASDAKGMLPMWIQKLGVPGAVIKDVGLFMDWRARSRSGNS